VEDELTKNWPSSKARKLQKTHRENSRGKAAMGSWIHENQRGRLPKKRTMIEARRKRICGEGIVMVLEIGHKAQWGRECKGTSPKEKTREENFEINQGQRRESARGAKRTTMNSKRTNYITEGGLQGIGGEEKREGGRSRRAGKKKGGIRSKKERGGRRKQSKRTKEAVRT